MNEKEVINRLKRMSPNIQLEPFDETRKHDWFYCIEWGIKKGQYLEQLVLERYINELNDTIQP